MYIFARECALHWTGVVLGELRREAGITRSQLSLDSGVAASTLAAVEGGRRETTVRKLENILGALGYELEVVPVSGVGRGRRAPNALRPDREFVSDVYDDLTDRELGCDLFEVLHAFRDSKT